MKKFYVVLLILNIASLTSRVFTESPIKIEVIPQKESNIQSNNVSNMNLNSNHPTPLLETKDKTSSIATTSPDDPNKKSPFSSVRTQRNNTIQISLDEKTISSWHTLLSINNIGADALINFAKSHYGERMCDLKIECYKYHIIKSLPKVYQAFQNEVLPDHVPIELQEAFNNQNGLDVESTHSKYLLNKARFAENVQLSKPGRKNMRTGSLLTGNFATNVIQGPGQVKGNWPPTVGRQFHVGGPFTLPIPLIQHPPFGERSRELDLKSASHFSGAAISGQGITAGPTGFPGSNGISNFRPGQSTGRVLENSSEGSPSRGFKGFFGELSQALRNLPFKLGLKDGKTHTTSSLGNSTSAGVPSDIRQSNSNKMIGGFFPLRFGFNNNPPQTTQTNRELEIKNKKLEEEVTILKSKVDNLNKEEHVFEANMKKMINNLEAEVKLEEKTIKNTQYREIWASVIGGCVFGLVLVGAVYICIVSRKGK